jgi:peroxiredoxin
LEKYDYPLSSSFKENEKQRLLYNNAFLKHHVIFLKAFMTGSLIKVEPSYYDFDNQLSLKDERTVLSSKYLWYAVFRLRDLAIKRQKIDSLLSTEMLSVADNLYGSSKLGDVIKMRLLYDIRAKDKRKYKRLIAKTGFIDPDTKLILDSVSNAVFSVPYVGKDAPEFKLPDIKGDTISLSQFKGKQVIINFWAGWCAPCIKEFPNENALYKKYMTTKDLVVINVCLDTSVDQWKKLSERHSLSVIYLFADQKQALILKKRYNVSSLPKSILIDHNFKIKNNNFKRAGQVEATDL